MRRCTLVNGSSARLVDRAAQSACRHGIMARAMAIPKDITFVTFDVYGTLIDWEHGRIRRVQDRGRTRRLHDRARRADPALLRSPEADPGGLVRALRRGPAPHRGTDREDARLAARAVPRRLPARLGPALAGVQGDQPRPGEDREEVQGRADLEHRRQAARPDPPPHPARLRPGRHRPAGPLLQARPGALRRVRAADRRQEGLGPRRRQLLLRRRAVPEAQDPGDLGQPRQGDARVEPEEAGRRGRQPARGDEAPRHLVGPARSR